MLSVILVLFLVHLLFDRSNLLEDITSRHDCSLLSVHGIEIHVSPVKIKDTQLDIMRSFI